MNRNKHLLLWSSLGVLALLVMAWADENVFREWRQIQRSALTATGPLDVRLRQISIPALRANDRCVSCHVGMAPGVQLTGGAAVLKEHPRLPHEPSEFGCTVCHGGQGFATDKNDAHGDVEFWPEPMIPLKHAYAGCGSCHTHLKVPAQPALEHGRALIERYDCFACHRIDERGGTLRPDGLSGMAGSDLSHAGAAGFAPDWYQQHLKTSQAAAAGPWKSSFGPIKEADRTAIEAYLSSRVGAPGLVEAKALFHTLGCRGCHKIGGVGGDDGPDLTLSGQKDPALLDFTHVRGKHTVANWHAEHLRAPERIVPGSKMPNFALTEPQVEQLTYYLMSLRRSSFPDSFWPKDRVRAERLGEREFATDGGTLYNTFCAACHGDKGEGRRYPVTPPFPAAANPDFLAIASDELIAATIQHGRPGRRMPAWGDKEGGLRPEEIQNIIGYLRQMSGIAAPPPDSQPRRWAAGDVELGARLFADNCATCHGSQGAGLDAPALNNKVLQANATDTYLFQTILRGRRGTVMPSYGQGSTVHPALTQAEIEALVSFIRTWEKTDK